MLPTREKPNDENLILANSQKVHVDESENLHRFLKIFLIPREINSNGLIKKMIERHLVSLTNDVIIKYALTLATLSPIDFVALLKWIYEEKSKPYAEANSLLSVVRIQNKNLSMNVEFSTIQYYDTLDAAFDFNLPQDVLPLEYSILLLKEDMEKKLMLKPFDLKSLHNTYFKNELCPVLNDPKQGPYLLSLISRHFDELYSEEAARVINILSNTPCIPTTKGMKKPNDSFIPSDSLKKDLAITKLNIRGITNDLTKTESFDRTCVSVNFLQKIGCRSLDIDSITTNQKSAVDEQLKKVVRELMSQPMLSDSDKKILKTKKSFEGKQVKIGIRSRFDAFLS